MVYCLFTTFFSSLLTFDKVISLSWAAAPDFLVALELFFYICRNILLFFFYEDDMGAGEMPPPSLSFWVSSGVTIS